MNLLDKLRRLYYRDRLALSEIERRTGLTRKTVRDNRVTPYAWRLLKMLETDARPRKRERRTALKLCAELKVLEFNGDYSRVTEFIRPWREGGGAAVVKAFVPLQFESGEAHQFDWSEEHIAIGGVWRKVLLAHLKLCFSRAFVVQAYPTRSHETLFDAHTRAFAALGGIPAPGPSTTT